MKYSISSKTSLAVLLSLLLLTSYEDPIDATTWRRVNNGSFFKEYALREDRKRASILGSPAYVCMKWPAHGEGKEYPIETSRIKCHYETRMFVGNKVVDSSYGSEHSVEFTINHGPKK